MKTTLSEKRQVALPKALCDELELEPGMQIYWEVADRRLIGRPIPKSVLDRLTGIHKGGPDLVADLLEERRKDRERENR